MSFFRWLFRRDRARPPVRFEIAEHPKDELSSERRQVLRDMSIARAPRNPNQTLFPQGSEQLTGTELVFSAHDAQQLVMAVGTIAKRHELLAQNIDALNRSLGEFKAEIIEPFREELKHLRYNTGDRMTHVSTDLERVVNTLERVINAAGARIERAARPESYTARAAPEIPDVDEAGSLGIGSAQPGGDHAQVRDATSARSG